MKTTRRYQLLTSLVALMALVSAESQAAPDVPRLVVNVVIDQLRTDYLEAYSQCYGERGFRRLMEQGRVYSQAQYPFSQTDRASAVATLLTGATPYEHGIVAQRWLDRQTLQPKYCVDDKAFAPFGTSENGSALNLAVSSLADEMKVASDGRSLVYSIAPFRDASILAAGHAADGAFWLNDHTGQWTTTSYYGTLPQWLTSNDANDPLSRRIDKMVWEPLSTKEEEEEEQTKQAPEPKKRSRHSNRKDKAKQQQQKPFKYPFKGNDRFYDFKTSALVNDEVMRLALLCMQQTGMGQDEVTDLLNLTFYAGNYQHASLSTKPRELKDIYRRLDHTLGELMDSIQAHVGTENVVFVVTSTGYSDDENADLSSYRIPTGEFSISKAQLLLNMYLVAVYGEGQYVEASMGNQLYLNQKLIERRGLNMAELLERAQDFLIQMTGVRDVYTSRRLALASADPIVSRMRNGYNPRCSGDILIKVAPGWHLVNETLQEDHIIRDSYLSFPLFFLGPTIKAEKIESPVTMDQVAPTIAKSIRIRAPNGCASVPLF